MASSSVEAMESDPVEASSKRKGSPLSKEDAKKQSVDPASPGPMRRQSSLPNIAKTSATKGKGSNMAFSDMVKITFNDPTFAKSVAPVMYDMLSPLIQDTIKSAVKAVTSDLKTTVVDEMVKSNNELQQLVKDQTEIINTQALTIEKQKKLIDNQNTLLDSKSARIEELECNTDYLLIEMDSLKAELNDLEQYGRRNSLRLNNFIPTTPTTDEHDLANSVCNFLNQKVLKGANPLNVRDIERCHFIGRTRIGRPKQIIIKFAHYQDRKRVFGAKSNLKDNPHKIFLTEDLTSANHVVVKQLLPLKKNKKIDSFWTMNGQIYVKKEQLSDPVKIRVNDLIDEKLNIELEASEDEPAGEPLTGAMY